MSDPTFDYKKDIDELRQIYLSGKTKSYEWRLKQLHGLLKMVEDEQEAMCEALNKDLKKCVYEAKMFEMIMSQNEIVCAINNLEKWMKPVNVEGSLLSVLDSHYTQCEPLGVVLIIGAWNYPIYVSILPLVGAIAAGNCVINKPSEMATHTAELLDKLFSKYLDDTCIKVINGGIPETTALLNEKFDHIFYTGNSTVGKIILHAAAKYLTPVTLELGGKSPVIVDDSSDAMVAARRIVFGKIANLGQTCIAPDYILCTKKMQDDLIKEIKLALNEFCGEETEKADLCRLINIRHFNRVKSLMTKGNIVIGGKSDEETLFIEPTVLTDVSLEDPIMQEEIFGPLLPIITVENVDEAINIINSREKALTMYIFSKNTSNVKKIVSSTSTGSVCVNDTLMQLSLTSLPFGGVGNSGMGNYHGKFSFETFSHKKSYYVRSQAMEFVNTLRYPPYSANKLWSITKLGLKIAKK